MRPTSRLTRVLAAVGAVALLATACGDDGTEPSGEETTSPATEETTPAGDGDGEETEAAGSEFTVYLGEPKALGPPQRVTESEGALIARSLFSPLVTFDPETVQPQWGEDAPNAVAAEVEGSEDSTQWTITLKEGWTFHNGEPVTAQSYVDAWNWGAYGPNAAEANYFFADIEGYEALNPTAPEGETEAPEPEAEELSGLEVVDEQTFTVTLSEPFSQYPLKIGYTAFNPMPPSAFDDIDAYNEEPIGNGPYQMAGPWEHDQQITLERYEDYAGTAGNAERIVGQIYSDVNTAYNDLLAGNVDVMDQIPPERIDEARSQFSDRIFTHTSSYFGFIGFPMYDEAFQDVDLRRAFSAALDRQAIIDNILKNGEPATSYLAPVINGYREGACGEYCTHDPELAQELYEESGGYDGTLEIWFNSGAGHEPVFEAVANQWRQTLGIEDVEFQSLEFADYLGNLEEETVTGPWRLAWVMDYPSPQNYLGNLFACEGSANYSGYCNEEADALVQQANATADPDEATELYQQAEDMMLEDLPVIPFYHRSDEGIHSERVSNVTFDPFSTIKLAEVEITG